VSGVLAGRAAVRSDPGRSSGTIARRERFAVVGSTNDVVRGWLAAGEPEVCLAVADRQSAGRGRAGRTWQAPDGAALLISLGFRPAWLAPERTWQLAALVALAMAETAEDHAGLPSGAIRLKWPNDLVVEDAGPTDPRAGSPRKLAGLLGETDGLGSTEPRVTIGLGINVDWPPSTFPADLADTMTSLNEISGGVAVDRERLLDGFLQRLEPRIAALRSGDFSADDWSGRQLTTGRTVRLDGPDGTAEIVLALGVDAASGALLVADPAAAGGRRAVFTGEIRHLRLEGAGSSASRAADGPRTPIRAGL
jgi:BirA family biotin operon repressor/biotin-[acetyl-CoA-carboxylase] ligase